MLGMEVRNIPQNFPDREGGGITDIEWLEEELEANCDTPIPDHLHKLLLEGVT